MQEAFPGQQSETLFLYEKQQNNKHIKDLYCFFFLKPESAVFYKELIYRVPIFKGKPTVSIEPDRQAKNIAE